MAPTVPPASPEPICMKPVIAAACPAIFGNGRMPAISM
jgi:hypothetical protein